MVCDGIAGVGATGNTPEKKATQSAQPKQQEEASAWDEVKNGAKKVANFVYDHSGIGIIDNAFDLGIKEHAKESLDGAGEKVKDAWENYTIAGKLYQTIFDSDEK